LVKFANPRAWNRVFQFANNSSYIEACKFLLYQVVSLSKKV